MNTKQIHDHVQTGDIKAICDYANNLAQEGDYTSSIALLSKALMIAPFDKDLRHTRGRKYIGALRFEESVADLKIASMQLEDDWEPRYYMAVSYFLSGQYAQARHYHLESMRLMEKDGIEAIPASVDWIWMSSMRLNDISFANEILDKVTLDTKSEDGDYKARVLLYKGVYSSEDFVEKYMEDNHPEDRKNIFRLMLMYGLSNYYRHVKNDTQKADALCAEIVSSPKYHNLFAYIQATQDLNR